MCFITCSVSLQTGWIFRMYSQRSEEEHILKAVHDIKAGSLLDIGAFNPTVFSNSRALIEQGWKAVLIEPSPGPTRKLVEEYGKCASVKVVCAAVSVMEENLVEINVSDDGVSSTDLNHWKETGGHFGKLLVGGITIHQILQRFGRFDFVSIDTEGTSVDIFKVLLMTEMFPKCICVEHDRRIIEAMQFARGRGYHSVHESEENLVFSL